MSQGAEGRVVPVPDHIRPPAGGYLTVALPVGLISGAAMGAVAAARRTEAAVPLDDGGREVAAAEARIERVLPRGFPRVRSIARLCGALLDYVRGFGQ